MKHLVTAVTIEINSRGPNTFEYAKIRIIEKVLEKTNNNKTKAALIIGCSLKMLRDMVNKHKRLHRFKRKPGGNQWSKYR